MADYADRAADFADAGIKLVAGSADSEEDARGFGSETGWPGVMLHGLDARTLATELGVYEAVRQGAPHLQPAAFLLDDAGRVVHAVIASGKVGRLTARDALTMLVT